MISSIKNWLEYKRLSKIETHLASSLREKKALYRFRYRRLIDEMRKQIPTTPDHEQKELSDEFDSQEHVHSFYSGTPDNISGTIRYSILSYREISKEYDVTDIPFCEELLYLKANFLITNPDAPPYTARALINAILEHALKHYDGSIILLGACDPGLLGYYRKLGFRAYRHESVYFDDGLRLFVQFWPYDLKYLKKINSILYRTCKKFNHPKNTHTREISHYLKQLQQAILKQKDQLLDEVYSQKTAGIFSLLTKDEISTVTSLVTIRVLANHPVAKEGVSDKEIFVILKGELQLNKSSEAICTLGPGDICGELAFFLGHGKRASDIVATTDCELLLIRRNAIKKLDNKDLAIKALYAISHLLAEKLVKTTAQLSQTKHPRTDP